MNGSWTTISGSAYGWVYLFQGGRLDGTTGDYDFGEREEDPTTDQWITADPIGFAAGDIKVNRFEGNEPNTSVDPSGLDAAIAQAGWHTGFAVDLYLSCIDCNGFGSFKSVHKIGVVQFDFRAAGYTNGNVNPKLVTGTPGEILVSFMPGDGKITGTRTLSGTSSQSNRVINTVLDTWLGKSFNWLMDKIIKPPFATPSNDSKMSCDEVGKLLKANAFKSFGEHVPTQFMQYSVLLYNCNSFTTDMLNTYVGYQTGVRALKGQGLIESFDEEVAEGRNDPKHTPAGYPLYWFPFGYPN